jgi:hypothetical protein
MNKIISGALCALALATAGAIPTDALASPEKAGKACLEDQPCFRWSNMGNGARGVTLTSGRHVVVSVCRFQRLDHRGRIDWQATPHLKGDSYARRAAC